MFDYIGKKLKTFALILFIINIIAGVLTLIISFVSVANMKTDIDTMLKTIISVKNIIYFVIYIFFAWLFPAIVYAIGEIVDNTGTTAMYTEYIARKLENSKKDTKDGKDDDFFL